MPVRSGLMSVTIWWNVLNWSGKPISPGFYWRPPSVCTKSLAIAFLSPFYWWWEIMMAPGISANSAGLGGGRTVVRVPLAERCRPRREYGSAGGIQPPDARFSEANRCEGRSVIWNTTRLEMTESQRKFIEKLGFYYESYGVPRIGGRMLGLLLVAGEPVSAEQMSATLLVSRSSISTNIRLLMSYAWSMCSRNRRTAPITSSSASTSGRMPSKPGWKATANSPSHCARPR